MKTSHSSIANKNNRLGRGLSALLGSSQDSYQVLSLDIEKIYPKKDQPRTIFDKEKLKELCESIKKNGVLQPILVQKKGNDYQIIVGERRWRAVCMAGLRKIPAIVKNPEPYQSSLWALIENIQRENLSPIEEARAIRQIMDEKNLSQETLAKSLGRSRSSLANSLRLLNLDPEVQQMVETKKISFAQARELLRFKSPKEQRKMARVCLKRSLTVKSLSREARRKNSENDRPFWVEKILSHLERQFSRRLRLDYSKGRGRLIFSFQSEAELKTLLNRLWGK